MQTRGGLTLNSLHIWRVGVGFQPVVAHLDSILQKVSRHGECPSWDVDDWTPAHVICNLLCIDCGAHKQDTQIFPALEQRAEDDEQEVRVDAPFMDLPWSGSAGRRLSVWLGLRHAYLVNDDVGDIAQFRVAFEHPKQYTLCEEPHHYQLGRARF